MGTQRGKNDRDLSLVGSLDSACLNKGFFFCLGHPVKNTIFLAAHFLTLLVLPIAQQPRQTGVLGRLSLSLWFILNIKYSKNRRHLIGQLKRRSLIEKLF
jgi:hypothetical protein